MDERHAYKLLKLKASVRGQEGEVEVGGAPIIYRFYHVIGNTKEHDSCLEFTIKRDMFTLDFSETKKKTTIHGFIASNGIDYSDESGGIKFRELSTDYPMFFGSLLYFMPSGILQYSLKNAIYNIAEENGLTYGDGSDITESSINLEKYTFDVNSIIKGPGFSIPMEEGFYMCRKCAKIDYNQYLEVDEDGAVDRCSDCKFWDRALS